MFFVFNQRGAFQCMIRPFFIEQCESNCCVLYIQDALGRFCTLTFPSRALLSEAMQRFRDTQKVCVQCEIEFYNPYAEREREIVIQEEQEKEEEYEIEIE